MGCAGRRPQAATPPGAGTLSDDFSGQHLRERSRGRHRRGQKFHHGWKNQWLALAISMRQKRSSWPAFTLHGRQGVFLRPATRRWPAPSVDVLSRAIRRGGTTLRDFVNSDGNPGYFAQELLVYEREGLPCFQCQAPCGERLSVSVQLLLPKLPTMTVISRRQPPVQIRFRSAGLRSSASRYCCSTCSAFFMDWI